MGVMEQFLKDVRDNLSKYISIEIMERKDACEFDVSNLEKKEYLSASMVSCLKRKG